MAYKKCEAGHVYDDSINQSCPYCNGGENRINFGEPAGSDVGKTMPVFQQPGGDQNMGNGEVGVTVAPGSYQRAQAAPQQDTGKTVAVFKKKMNLEPVVGWFVCIEGADKGKSYCILAKNNSIGRSENMDICIKGDDSISRENHARLGYDEKHNTFHLIPGESANNIYVKDEPVYAPVILDSYTVIEIGETKLLFVPLCNDRFTWKDGMKE